MKTVEKCNVSKKSKAGHFPVYLLGFLFLYGISACINDNLDDCRIGYGSVRVSTNWTPRSEGIEIPQSYTLHTDKFVDSTLLTANEPVLLSYKFPHSMYFVCIHNKADGITVNDKTVRVDTVDGWVKPNPGWFFSYSGYLLVADDSISLTARMRQQLRLFTIELTPKGDAAERLVSLNATLNGVASELNMDNEYVSGTAGAAFRLTAFPDKTWQASARLLGLTDGEQILTLTAGIRASSGDSLQVANKVNVSQLLIGFNVNKEYPITLKANILLNTDPNNPQNVILGISDMEVIYGTSIVAA
ncbi:MAG: hypothetical protein LBQ39_06225 [Tannerellaceae bacterium]|jgi:hypothetical protein|nr:hypothetical protein [Tannerellaceae bacterium]